MKKRAILWSVVLVCLLYTSAQRYLIPKQCEENGLQPQDVIIEADIIQKIIREYTREAGVRNLERSIATICRKIAKEVAQGAQGPFVVDEEKLREFLGPRRFLDEVMEGKDEIGAVSYTHLDVYKRQGGSLCIRR